MEREVRYCMTEDGVRIAYSVEGEGSPLLVTPYFFDTFTRSDETPQWRSMMDQIRAGRLVVRYDHRGSGLSQREIDDVSNAAFVRDIQAVVRAAGLKQFAMLAWAAGGTVAIEYAARHARNVSSLILYGVWARAEHVMPLENLKGLAAMCRTNWQMASQLFTDMSLRHDNPHVGVVLAEQLRASISSEFLARVLEDAADATGFLSAVKCRTLVLHRVDDAAVPLAASQRIASGI